MPEPSTLAELQGLSTEEVRTVESYQYQGSPSPKRLIEGIIRLASAEVSWQGEANAESLRGFWYNPVKPIVETAFPEKLDDPNYKFGRRMSQYLSDVLSELVQKGELTYRDLNILDDSRQRALHTDSIEDDKILFVEKDAAYRKLKPLPKGYELPAAVNGWIHDPDDGSNGHTWRFEPGERPLSVRVFELFGRSYATVTDDRTSGIESSERSL